MNGRELERGLEGQNTRHTSLDATLDTDDTLLDAAPSFPSQRLIPLPFGIAIPRENLLPLVAATVGMGVGLGVTDGRLARTLLLSLSPVRRRLAGLGKKSPFLWSFSRNAAVFALSFESAKWILTAAAAK